MKLHRLFRQAFTPCFVVAPIPAVYILLFAAPNTADQFVPGQHNFIVFLRFRIQHFFKLAIQEELVQFVCVTYQLNHRVQMARVTKVDDAHTASRRFVISCELVGFVELNCGRLDTLVSFLGRLLANL